MKRWLIYYAAILALALSMMAMEAKGQESRKGREFPSSDGCNTCTCMDDACMLHSCTLMGCIRQNWDKSLPPAMAVPGPEERKQELDEENTDPSWDTGIIFRSFAIYGKGMRKIVSCKGSFEIEVYDCQLSHGVSLDDLIQVVIELDRQQSESYQKNDAEWRHRWCNLARIAGEKATLKGVCP